MDQLRLYTDRCAVAHATGDGHPECPARINVIWDAIAEDDTLAALPRFAPREAGATEITRAHDLAYVHRVQDSIPDDGLFNIEQDNETHLCPNSLEAIMCSAGAACQAVEDVAKRETRRAFCAMRPPGHHALPNKAMGFCVFNNIFIGARHAQEFCGLKRIAIVDFDVHHGNGTEEMTRNAEDILFISSQQMPLWPGTGDPQYNIDGKILNIPLSAGCETDDFRKAYQTQAFPALHNFKPDLLMISAGFDAHKDDPIGGLALIEEDFAWVTRELCTIAEQYCDGKIVSVLEGGYNLKALGRSTAAHLRALLNAQA